jgi:hypothetical protein
LRYPIGAEEKQDHKHEHWREDVADYLHRNGESYATSATKSAVVTHFPRHD